MPQLPLLVPALIVGVLLMGVASRPLARALASPTWSAVLLIGSVVLVVAVTLTPQDLARVGAPQWGPIAWLLQTLGERWLNVLLLVPLGVAVVFIGRPALRLAAIAGALVLPWLVEGIQHVVAPLARDSQWQDVADNTLGVLAGLALGALIQCWRKERGGTTVA